MRKSALVKGVAVLLIVFTAGLASGCFGKFQLTRRLYDVNRSVEDKYLRSAVTWLFAIPYGFTAFLDFFVFNLIEFWSGENPIAGVPVVRVLARGGEKAVVTIGRDGDATVATVEKYVAGRLVATLSARDDLAGRVTAVVRGAGGNEERLEACPRLDGSVEVTRISAAGVARVVYSAPQAEAAAARAAVAAQTAAGSAARRGPAPRLAVLALPALEG